MNYKKYLVKASAVMSGLAMAVVMPMAVAAAPVSDPAMTMSPHALNVALGERSFDVQSELDGADSSLEISASFEHPIMNSLAFAKKMFWLFGLKDEFQFAEVNLEESGAMSAKFEQEMLAGGEVKLEVKIDEDGTVEIKFEEEGTEGQIIDRAMTFKMNHEKLMEMHGMMQM